tara:strand:- start:8288 stop:8569 length:282 start_codon:yes stop_codon:yes gene_type:complete
MGSVVKLHNHVVLDQDLISKVWAVANFLRKDGGTAPAMRLAAQELADIIPLKMYDQNCSLSDEFIVHEDLLDEWAAPIRERMIPVPQGEFHDR